MVLPPDLAEAEYRTWGYSLGYALRAGLRHLYMLDGPEIEFELELPWEHHDAHGSRKVGALLLIDPAVGGSGFLDRAAQEFHKVAEKALEHLEHANCESACYRCLKSYHSQWLLFSGDSCEKTLRVIDVSVMQSVPGSVLRVPQGVAAGKAFTD